MDETKKVTECPNCESDEIGTRWERGRKLQQYCRECFWEGEEYTPTPRRVRSTRFVDANQFPGYHYEVFDKYGHILVSSRSYRSRSDALIAIDRDLKPHVGSDVDPCTAVLWPATVKVKGELIKSQPDGELTGGENEGTGHTE